jgi:hypothetical protein
MIFPELHQVGVDDSATIRAVLRRQIGLSETNNLMFSVFGAFHPKDHSNCFQVRRCGRETAACPSAPGSLGADLSVNFTSSRRRSSIGNGIPCVVAHCGNKSAGDQETSFFLCRADRVPACKRRRKEQTETQWEPSCSCTHNEGMEGSPSCAALVLTSGAGSQGGASKSECVRLRVRRPRPRVITRTHQFHA